MLVKGVPSKVDFLRGGVFLSHHGNRVPVRKFVSTATFRKYHGVIDNISEPPSVLESIWQKRD